MTLSACVCNEMGINVCPADGIFLAGAHWDILCRLSRTEFFLKVLSLLIDVCKSPLYYVEVINFQSRQGIHVNFSHRPLASSDKLTVVQLLMITKWSQS